MSVHDEHFIRKIPGSDGHFSFNQFSERVILKHLQCGLEGTEIVGLRVFELILAVP